jgi:NADPH:quinone reductase-like Zn-dependent oxidoreductase
VELHRRLADVQLLGDVPVAPPTGQLPQHLELPRPRALSGSSRGVSGGPRGISIVVGTASPANLDYLRSLGAVPVSCGDGLADRVRGAAPQGVDAVFDATGHDVLEASIALRGGTTDRIVTIADARAFELGVTFTGDARRFGPQLAAYARLAADGLLRVRIDRVLPLASAAEAHELSEYGHPHGKLVLRP